MLWEAHGKGAWGLQPGVLAKVPADSVHLPALRLWPSP